MTPDAFTVSQWLTIAGALVLVATGVATVIRAKEWLQGVLVAGYLGSDKGRAQVEEIAGRAVKLDLERLLSKLDRLVDEIDRLVKSHDRQADVIDEMRAELLTLKARAAVPPSGT